MRHVSCQYKALRQHDHQQVVAVGLCSNQSGDACLYYCGIRQIVANYRVFGSGGLITTGPTPVMLSWPNCQGQWNIMLCWNDCSFSMSDSLSQVKERQFPVLIKRAMSLSVHPVAARVVFSLHPSKLPLFFSFSILSFSSRCPRMLSSQAASSDAAMP